MSELALRYGSALYSLALELNKIKDWQKEIKELIKLLKENPKFLDVLNSDFLSISKRKEILKETINFDDEQINSFLYVILDNNRISNLLEILEAFNTLCNQHLGIIEGIVYSVMRLDEKQMNLLEDKLSEKEGVKVELKNIIDKSLIGGIKVLINDHVYDDSIKYHAEKLKNTLRK